MMDELQTNPNFYISPFEENNNNNNNNQQINTNNQLSLKISSRNSIQKSVTTIDLALQDKSWYCNVERDLAQHILKCVTYPKAIFLVRPSSGNGYAISIKFNENIEHIKIHVKRMGLDKHFFYLIDDLRFSTIEDLIEHYRNNSLENNFPQLPTTLGVPYREILPKPIGCAIALYDFNSDEETAIKLKRGDRLYLIDMNNPGWWLVYNDDGHLGYAPSNYLQETTNF